jgi:hypothetical protein
VIGKPINSSGDPVHGLDLVAAVLVLISLLVFAGPRSALAAEPPASQCIGCHTDAEKLKALTPPDPAPTEEGEG